MSTLDFNEIRKDFPLIDKGETVYLDNSATSQKPVAVLNKEREFYEAYNANPFRGIYEISEKATCEYEEARKTVAGFIGCSDPDCLIFTRNTTESMNLLAYSLGELLVNEGDEIIVSIAEHHSNMLPWRMLAARKGAEVKYVYCDSLGEIHPEELKNLITAKTKIVAITHMSNVFGKQNDIKGLAKICHEYGAVLVADGAQSTPHIKVNVEDLDVDFFGFSGHKMLGPMGIGGLYGKMEYLEKMPPFFTGGEMIETVTLDNITYAEVPHKFEAGTVNAASAVALAEAVRYMENIGMDVIEKRENMLCDMMLKGMSEIPGITVIGGDKAEDHHGIVAFRVKDVHPHDAAQALAFDNIAVRAGHHCAQPLHRELKLMATNRASVMFYNNEEDIKRFLESLKEIRGKMGYRE